MANGKLKVGGGGGRVVAGKGGPDCRPGLGTQYTHEFHVLGL